MGLSNDLSCEAGSFSCCRPNPHGVFSQWFEALFPHTGALGYVVCFVPRHSSKFICARMWGYRVASGQTAGPVHPTLRQSRSRHSHGSSLHPSCPSPPLLPVWMNVYFLSPWCRTSLPFDFLSVLVVGGGAVCLPTPPSWFLFFVFKLLLSFFWYCEEAQCVYLRLRLSWKLQIVWSTF